MCDCVCVLSDVQTKRLSDAMRRLSIALIRHVWHKELAKKLSNEKTQKRRNKTQREGAATHRLMLSGQLFPTNLIFFANATFLYLAFFKILIQAAYFVKQLSFLYTKFGFISRKNLATLAQTKLNECLSKKFCWRPFSLHLLPLYARASHGQFWLPEKSQSCTKIVLNDS